MSYQKKLADALRVLSMDAVQHAKSGHPGMPMGMADIATVLWQDFLHHHPKNPHWFNRDRFVLSNGHGSMLLYALLHLSGYDLSMEDLQHFRQWHSKTPGHPEQGMTPGVETTTGPLGQGFANAVGFALAERTLAAQFNQPNYLLVDHYTYVFVGDGCLMEGISHEAASLAGCLGLGKLIAFWDDNGISIDGDVSGWFRDNTPQRFRAYDWHVVEDVDGHDAESIRLAIEAARRITDKPSLICCKTQIAFGSPNFAGRQEAHGAPLGEEEIRQTREALGWSYPPFTIPEPIYTAWNGCEKGKALEEAWNTQWRRYQTEYPTHAAEFSRRIQGQLPENGSEKFAQILAEWHAAPPAAMATRKASQASLNKLAPWLPELLGGSADLTESNLTFWQGAIVLDKTHPGGNYLHYGVREFAMSAISNGLALHGGFIPYNGTFLVFSDYARNAVRLAALMKQRVIFLYSHDSIALGEDGPTHQPIEQINSLRIIPGLTVWRPSDAIETLVAWQQALQQNGPSCLLLTRQAVPTLPRDKTVLASIQRGGYILFEPPTPPQALIIATGSEVSLALQAAQQVTDEGLPVRVVSMPSAERFAEQKQSYQDKVLPPHLTRRLVVEAGCRHFWYRYVGPEGKVLGIDRFGESAPGEVVLQAFGFTVKHIMQTLHDLFKLSARGTVK